MDVHSAIGEKQIYDAQTPASQPSKRLALFGVIGLFVVFGISVLLRPPAGDYLTICGFKNLTGLPCPGCGLTHSFCALGKGEVTDAFGFNLLGPILYLILILLWIRSASILLNKTGVVRFLDRVAKRLNLARAFAAAFAVYGIVRIGYVITYHPAAFRNSPLSELIARLIH